MKKLVLLVTLVVASAIWASDVEFNIKNTLKYGDGKQFGGDNKDIEAKKRYLEDWIDFNVSDGAFSLDLRLEVTDPSQQGEKIAEFTRKSISFERDNLSVTAGDFYTIFGRGVILDLREERANFFDNKIFGGKVEYTHDYFTLQALGGNSNYKYQDDSAADPAVHTVEAMDNSILGADLVLNLSDYFEAEDISYNLGGSYLFMEGDSVATDQYLYNENFIKKTELFGINAAINWNDIDFYNEYAIKSTHRNPRAEGWANYTSLSYFGLDNFSFTLEYKDYYKFAANPNNFSSGFAPYQNPAQVVIDHTAHLLKNNAHTVNANDEVGYQFQFRTTAVEKFEFALIGAFASLHDGSSIIPNSDENFLPYYDVWGEGSFKGHHYGVKAGSGYFRDAKYEKNLGMDFDNSDIKTVYDERTTFMAAFDYELSKNDLIKVDGEFQLINHHAGEESHEYQDYFASIEYSYPEIGYINVSMIMSTGDGPAFDEDEIWLGYEAGYNISENHKLELFYGRERAGIKCSGGACRQVPEFDGFKLSLISTF
jgi:hypothetical protein